MSDIALVVLSLLALIRLSSSGSSGSVLVGEQEAKEKQFHSFIVHNSLKEGSSLEFKCLHWGEKIIKDQSLAYGGEVSWTSKVSADAVHCTCIMSFPPELAQNFSTTEFDAIDSKHIKEGVHKYVDAGNAGYFWRWHLLNDGIYYYDFVSHKERFVKKYNPAGNHQLKG